MWSKKSFEIWLFEFFCIQLSVLILYFNWLKMKKIKEMFEKHETEKIAKKYWRTFEQQKFRNDLAKALKDRRREEQKQTKKLKKKWLKYVRVYDGKPSSRQMLERAEKTPEYRASLLKYVKPSKEKEKLLEKRYGGVVWKKSDRKKEK